jgi:hypothetical protein
MNKPKIIIKLSGGLIEEIISNTDIDVVTLDEDIFDGGDRDDLVPFKDRENVTHISVYDDPEEFQERMNEEEDDWNQKVEQYLEEFDDDDDEDDDDPRTAEDYIERSRRRFNASRGNVMPDRDYEAPKTLPDDMLDDLPMSGFM